MQKPKEERPTKEFQRPKELMQTRVLEGAIGYVDPGFIRALGQIKVEGFDYISSLVIQQALQEYNDPSSTSEVLARARDTVDDISFKLSKISPEMAQEIENHLESIPENRVISVYRSFIDIVYVLEMTPVKTI